jgi:hypothetical protein
VRGIVEFELDHGRSLWYDNPGHGRVVGQHRVVLVRVLARIDGERPGDALDLGS